MDPRHLAAGLQEARQRRRRAHCQVGDARRRRCRTQLAQGRAAGDLVCSHRIDFLKPVLKLRGVSIDSAVVA